MFLFLHFSILKFSKISEIRGFGKGFPIRLEGNRRDAPSLKRPVYCVKSRGGNCVPTHISGHLLNCSTLWHPLGYGIRYAPGLKRSVYCFKSRGENCVPKIIFGSFTQLFHPMASLAVFFLSKKTCWKTRFPAIFSIFPDIF